MVILVSTTRFPLTKAKEVAKKYVEVSSKFKVDRSLEKPILQLAARIIDDYVETISITEVKEGKYEEIMRILIKQHLMYDIEGLEFKTETFFSSIEALPMVGFEMLE
jgi:hypothetical protein